MAISLIYNTNDILKTGPGVCMQKDLMLMRQLFNVVDGYTPSTLIIALSAVQSAPLPSCIVGDKSNRGIK
jgi:hypothetical protein